MIWNLDSRVWVLASGILGLWALDLGMFIIIILIITKFRKVRWQTVLFPMPWQMFHAQNSCFMHWKAIKTPPRFQVATCTIQIHARLIPAGWTCQAQSSQHNIMLACCCGGRHGGDKPNNKLLVRSLLDMMSASICLRPAIRPGIPGSVAEAPRKKFFAAIILQIPQCVDVPPGLTVTLVLKPITESTKRPERSKRAWLQNVTCTHKCGVKGIFLSRLTAEPQLHFMSQQSWVHQRELWVLSAFRHLLEQNTITWPVWDLDPPI